MRAFSAPPPYGAQSGNNVLHQEARVSYCFEWCPGEDSNLHELLHWYLKPARLPVPPPGQDGCRTRGAEMYALLRCLSTNGRTNGRALPERRTLWLTSTNERSSMFAVEYESSMSGTRGKS